MEHRWNRRVDTDMEVLVYHETVPVARACAENISLDGMFIRSQPLHFPNKTSLEVEVELTRHGQAQRYRIPALVVHSEAGGAGLMFQRVNTSVMDVLEELMRDNGESGTQHERGAGL